MLFLLARTNSQKLFPKNGKNNELHPFTLKSYTGQENCISFFPFSLLEQEFSRLLYLVCLCTVKKAEIFAKNLTKAGLPLIIHLKIPWLFPDFSLTFYSFPYRLTNKKIIFILYFEGAVSLQIWGLLLKEKGSKFFPLRVAPNEEGDGLSLSHEKVHPFPLWTK